MANRHTTLNSLFTGVADSIREKTGVTDTLLADNFPAFISGLNAGIYNQIPYSIDENGNIFNKIGWQITSQEVLGSTLSGFTTGYIPVKKGDKIDIYNIPFQSYYLKCYDSNKQFIDIGSGSTYDGFELKELYKYFYVSKTEDSYISFCLITNYSDTLNKQLDNVAYVRIGSEIFTNNTPSITNPIVTINDIAEESQTMVHNLKPITKLYKLSNDYNTLQNGNWITLNNVLNTYDDSEIRIALSNKKLVIYDTAMVNILGEDEFTLATLSSTSYFADVYVMKLNVLQFLVFYRYTTDTSGSLSAEYCRLITCHNSIASSTFRPGILYMSSAITLKVAQAASGAYTHDDIKLFELVKDNKNIYELGVLKEQTKYSSAGVCSADTIYFNGMYLNGISALSLFSTAWTSLVTVNPSNGINIVGHTLADGFKYGFSYYKETASGFTGGFAHRIRGRNGAFKNNNGSKAAGTFHEFAGGSSSDNSMDIIGITNDGSYIVAECVSNTLINIHLFAYNYSYDLYETGGRFNDFVKILTIPIAISGGIDNFYQTYYFDNNIFGIFIPQTNGTTLCKLYQIIRTDSLSYIPYGELTPYTLYSIGSVPVENISSSNDTVESSGIYEKSLHGIGDILNKNSYVYGK